MFSARREAKERPKREGERELDASACTEWSRRGPDFHPHGGILSSLLRGDGHPGVSRFLDHSGAGPAIRGQKREHAAA